MPDMFVPRRRPLPPIVKDLSYLRHGERALRARVFMPVQDGGPFPCLVDVHGGGWQRGDLEDRNAVGEFLGERGLVVVALNFRQGADAYPSSLADINYGVRWVKANAERFRIDPARVAVGGPSSGGHLAMLAAMRPYDRRYAAIPLPQGSPRVDARVHAVVMQSPIINPLSRYRSLLLENRRFRYGVEYWQTEANVAEGNPMLMLERGEQVELPPAIWIQGRQDPMHDYRDPESNFPGNEAQRFVTKYRAAGGRIQFVYFEKGSRDTNPFGLTHDFLIRALRPGFAQGARAGGFGSAKFALVGASPAR